MTQLTLVAGADPRILTTSDLLRYAKPSTPLEEALFDALKRERQDAEPWEQLAANYDADTPDDLEKLIDELKDNQKPDDFDDYVKFFDDVVRCADLYYRDCHPVNLNNSVCKIVKDHATLARGLKELVEEVEL